MTLNLILDIKVVMFVGGLGSGRFPPKSKTESKSKEYDAVTWLEHHPEDIPMARENLQARDRGFADDDIRQLMAAICLKACTDYKHAISRYVCDTKYGQKMIADCRKFFGGDIFQFFVNGMDVEEIERCIRATPENAINSIWKRMELSKSMKITKNKEEVS